MNLKENFKKYINRIKEKVYNNEKFEGFKNKVKSIKSKNFSNIKFDKKLILIISISFFFILFIGCFFTVQKNSKSYVIKRLTTVLEKGNNKALSKIITVDNMNKNLNAEDLKPVTEFYSSNKNRISELTNSLNSGKSIYSMNIKEKDYFLGKKYYIATKYRELNIKTDLEGANLYVNGVSEGIISGKEKKINLIAPGIYDIKLEYKGKDAVLQSEKKVILTENESTNIPLNGIKISVKTDYPDGKIYINDKDTSVKAKDFIDKGPFPTNGTYKISMKYNSPWGEITSTPIEIKENPVININLELKNENLKAQLKTAMEGFYNSVFSALNKENKEEIKGTTEDVKNKIYEILNEKYFILKNIYKLENLDIDLEKSTIKFENGVYDGKIVTSVNYLIKKDIFGIPLQSRAVNQNFFVDISYKNGSWIVTNIENFYLEK
ncbi:TcaA 3rd/4th domain-containing protein [Clostridium sp.]|uniref:TcaA 3rd/4th domain-containing protein n=1 Tax=Clostridium sp. TaxID=1506 RepID=UPI003993B368